MIIPQSLQVIAIDVYLCIRKNMSNDFEKQIAKAMKGGPESKYTIGKSVMINRDSGVIEKWWINSLPIRYNSIVYFKCVDKYPAVGDTIRKMYY